ncbi:MAG TPA: thioesterase family protein [Coleofasciculaceae cyanobacterium]|jgi:1,4-dihydroxy-2-naphthoyl-CoA hydrolase
MAFTYLRRVYLGDTDAAGVVYFAKGLEICHEAYEESLSKARISLMQMINQGKTALPIVHAEIDFLHPLFCGDQLQVSLIISQVDYSEFAIAYQIFPVNNLDQILVKAQTRHVCINPQIRKRIDLPQAILEWVNYF